MGRSKRRKNATYKKQWYRKLNDHWSREQKMRMKQILGQDPNTVQPVTGTIDGRDWKTFFPQPLKSSGFSWLEFARRVEKLQDEKNEQRKKVLEREKESLQSNGIDKEEKKQNDDNNNDENTKDIVMANPYKTVNTDLNDGDDEDEKCEDRIFEK